MFNISKEVFELQIKESIKIKLQHLGLETHYRKNNVVEYVRYPRYLTPTLSKLPPETFKEIENSHFSLKPLDKIIRDILEHLPNNNPQVLEYVDKFKKNYIEIFDFARNGIQCTTFGNLEPEINLLRGLYDLSVRYRKNKNLLVNCKHFISGFIKLYAARMGLTFEKGNIKNQFENFLTKCNTNITSFFKISDHKKFMDDVLGLVLERIDLTAIERKILTEFIDICPEHREIIDLMEQFYDAYYNKFIDKEVDINKTAAWIIKAFCDIHPFTDGNGRVARTLAFNFIHLRTNLIFAEEEIDNFGKDWDYIEATSRINQFPGNFDLLVSWVIRIILGKQKQIPASFFNSYCCGTLGCEPLPDTFKWDANNNKTIPKIKI